MALGGFLCQDCKFKIIFDIFMTYNSTLIQVLVDLIQQ